MLPTKKEIEEQNELRYELALLEQEISLLGYNNIEKKDKERYEELRKQLRGTR